VFGDGHEYEFALAGDDDPEFDEEQAKPEMRYQDVRSSAHQRYNFLTGI
jgi:transcription elongation factor SPT6